jgi:hypothetical protein
MMRRKNTISASELRRQLAALHEELAAPSGFRSKIIGRLAQETGQAVPQATSLWRRLLDLAFSRSFVPAALAGAALVFGIWFALRPLPQAAPQAAVGLAAPVQNPAQAPAPRQLARLHPKKSATTVQFAKALSAATEPVTEVQGEEVTHIESPAPGQGAAAQAQVQSEAQPRGFSAPSAPEVMPAAHFGGTGLKSSSAPESPASGGVGVAGLPPTPQPTATSLPQPLQGNSQVRRNRFLASRGEYAAIVFKLSVPGPVRIEIWDRLGRQVAVILEANYSAGAYESDWYGYDGNGQMLATGIYLVRVKTDQYDERHKAVLIR